MFKPGDAAVRHDAGMSDELPLFPTAAPEVFSDAAATTALFEPVLAALADTVVVTADDLARPTPCDGYTVGELRQHVLAWLQFFAAALNDPDGASPRIDVESWTLGDNDPAAIVNRAARDIAAAVQRGVADRTVVMSAARMAGDGVLAMALGEYLIHGWDLAKASGRAWPPATSQCGAAAAGPALAFLEGMVTPEYRGPDSGFFDAEVDVAADASAFDRLLGFAGRDPAWTRGHDR